MMKEENTPRTTEPVRPQQNSTMTHATTTTSPAVSLDWIKFDVKYFLTIPGILKILQFVFAIFCMALSAPARFGGTHFFLFVIVTTFLVTTFWICIYFLCIRQALTLQIPWLVVEFYFTIAATVAYFLGMVVQFSTVTGIDNAGTAGACFGLFNTLAYAAGAFFLFQDWRQSSDPNSPNVP